MRERLVIGGPLDGQTIAIDSDILLYPSNGIYKAKFVYIKKDLGVSNGPDGKKYFFLIPENWSVFDMMNHLTGKYGDTIPAH